MGVLSRVQAGRLCIYLGAGLPSIIAVLAQQVLANKHPGQHHAGDETANMRPEGHPADVVTNAIQSAEKLDGLTSRSA